jgi:ATP-dependent DNA helicase RecG
MIKEELTFLLSPVNKLPKIGEKTAEALARLGCLKVKDLLYHLPSSVVPKRVLPNLFQVETGETVITEIVIEGMDDPYKKKFQSRAKPYRIYCSTATGFIDIVYFNFFPNYLIEKLQIGEKMIVSGKLDRFNGKLQIAHPDYFVAVNKLDTIPKSETNYPCTYALTVKQIANFIEQALEKTPALDEWVEADLLKKREWLSWKESLKLIHKTLASRAYERLSYDELLAHQLAIGLVRKYRNKSIGQSISPTGSLKNKLLQNLGFTLTLGQIKVIEEIEEDQKSLNKMVRLIQGDVGSGKTVVALCAMLNSVECSKQAGIMAPTDILANQHFSWIEKVTKDFGVRVGLLTGKIKGKKREELLRNLAEGEIDILVGTHALFQEQVIFKDLNLVIIDEQHRFGVEQRLKLASKGENTDMLVMSATPIPRTLSMVMYGDMDISYLKEKPKNRIPIKTSTVSIDRLSEIVESMRKALLEGNKIYWICPLIEEPSEEEEEKAQRSDLAAAAARFNQFSDLFPGNVGLIHGKMKGPEKESVMQQFASGEVNLLVATTVIEVGIDVPDSTIIVIEQAERFGLAQLHQLRGRVGRGSKASYCILLYDKKISEASRARLKIMRESNDGFLIAEEDLKIRGGGEVLGTKQSGLPNFKVANILEQTELIHQAVADAEHVIATDPKLMTPRGSALKTLLYLFEYDKMVEYIHSS